MGRLIAIGDIHGHLSKLRGLIEEIHPQKDDRVVFLGDYIDRGPDSFGVVEFLLRFKEGFPRTVTLRGNHEDFVISLFQGNQNAKERDIWLKMNGGDRTIASYKRAGQYLKAHQEFYMALPVYWENEEYFFCHAGIRPRVPLNKQRPIDLIEIREPFLSSTENFGKTIVHGHTIVEEPEIRPNRINIDTGAGMNGPLTAIELLSMKIWQQW